ncbi:MAG: hypothetical protein ACYC1K_00425 [Minisyncoccota bacterium]
MGQKKRRLYQDAVLIVASILFAMVVVKDDTVYQFVSSLGDLRWLGIFISGIFFTSLFTTPPSIVLLGEFAQSTPLLPLAIVGGLGAVCGDYIIFHFVKDRISKDVEFLFSFSKHKRFSAVFKTHLFKFFVPFIGALIIASPLPDELGITMLGMSKVKNKVFLIISFIMNGLGIFVIGWLAKLIVEL